MNLGNATSCLLNEGRVPSFAYKSVRFADVEAYERTSKRPLDRLEPPCAASIQHFDPQLSTCHSILWEDDCQFGFHAIANSIFLRADVLLQEATDFLEVIGHNINSKEISDPVNVNFLADPLSPYENVLIAEVDSQIRRCHALEDEIPNEWETPLYELDGLLVDEATIPIHLQAEWIQQLSAHWTAFQQQDLGDEDLHVRSWYLNSERYQKWEHWRPMTLPRSTDHWWGSLRSTWHDIIDHDLPVHVHFVHPVAPRGQQDLRYPFDLIIAQNIEEDQRTSLVVTKFIGDYIRVNTMAVIVPEQVNKWSLIYASENYRFCIGPSAPVSFYRLCHTWHDDLPILAQLFPARMGDCFGVDIFPPEHFEDDDDLVNLMARSPIEALNRVPSDNEIDMEMNQLQARPENPESEEESNSLNSDSFSILLFTKTLAPVVGRMRPTSQNDMYRKAAEMLGIVPDSLLRLYQMPHPPDDLSNAHDRVCIAQNIGDIPQGSLAKLVLVDVVFCEQLPKLDVDVTRKVYRIPSPTTKQTLLRLLALAPYCDKWPCLTKLNDEFIPDKAPVDLRHADYVQITLSPPTPISCRSTRFAALALHHDYLEDDVEHLSHFPPDHLDLEQMPNPDSNLTVLEFEDPDSFELHQTSLHLNVPTMVFRLDEQHTIGDQIAEVVRANEDRADNVLLEALDRVPANIRDLHGLWTQVAEPWFNNHLWAQVLVWYISHVRWRICAHPRPVWLNEDVETWRETLLHSWSDQIDTADATEIAIVAPQPHPLEVGVAAHILLIQHHDAVEEHAGLVTLVDDGYRSGLPERQALVLPDRVSHELLLTIANRLTSCQMQPGQFICTSNCGAFDITHEPIMGHDGMTYNVFVHRNPQAPPLMAPLDWNLFPDSVPVDSPTLVRQLHTAIGTRRQAQPMEPINMRITSWFLNHNRHPRCLYGRDIDLPLNPQYWMPYIQHTWADLYDAAIAIDAFLVHPMPMHRQWTPGSTFHVIVHQEPNPLTRSVLITTFDQTGGNQDPVGLHRAFVVSHVLSELDLLQRVDLHEWCTDETWGHHCSTFHGSTSLARQRPFLCEHGHGFKIVLSDAPIRQWQEEDVTSWIQLRKSTPSAIEPFVRGEDVKEGKVKIDMKLALRAWEWIDSHFLLPSFVPPDDVHWHPASLDWLYLPIWDPAYGCCELAVYHDGTSTKAQGKGGGAVAVFIRSSDQWFQGGHWAFSLPGASSYKAELFAAMVASKAAYDIVKVVLCHQTWLPTVWFAYDSITVGKQAASEWKCNKEPKIGILVRTIRDLIKHRFGITCEGYHVRGHNGDPGNEIVDVLAGAAADGNYQVDIGDFSVLFQDDYQTGLQWMWVLFDRTFETFWKNGQLELPRYPTTEPDERVFPMQPLPETCETSGMIGLKVCSCNVLSLKAGIDAGTGLTGASRQEAILQQLHDAGVQIFALQETRVRSSRRDHHEHYVLLKGAASNVGQGGIMVGLSKVHPHGYLKSADRKCPVYFCKEQIMSIAEDPRLLLLRISTPVLKCILIAGHAPHSGADEGVIADWWKGISHKIPLRYQTWPRLLLCDANARVGANPIPGIGDFQAEKENEKAQPFEAFIQLNDLLLPSTFEQFQVGPGGTWKHPNGSWLRNDFIGVPRSWQYDSLQAEVSLDIDVSLHHEDHRAVFVLLNTVANGEGIPRVKPAPKLTREQFEHVQWGELQRPSDWTLDVHSHAHLLQQQLTDGCTPRKQIPMGPRKKCLSADTWQLVCEKRTARNLLHSLQQQQRRTLLMSVFDCWKKRQPSEQKEIMEWNNLLSALDRSIAECLYTFQQLGRLVTGAVRRDDKEFFSSLSATAAQFLDPADVKRFWATIRSAIPKYRQRRFLPDPMQVEQLEDAWYPYLEKLEAGCQVEAKDLVRNCHLFQQEHGSAFDHCHLAELPSLYALEDVLRETQPNRSTGLDAIPSTIFHEFAPQMARFFFQLVMKIHIWQSEPIQSKGGVLAMIPKTGGNQPQNYRGIMLLGTLSKRLHALMRKQLIRVLDDIRPPGQIGGFPRQQVTFGAHSVGTFIRMTSQAGLSSGVLYVDLSNAFHRLIRELVLGVQKNEDFEQVVSMLESDQFDCQGVREWAKLPGLLQRLRAPQLLIKLLSDVHHHTWFVLANQTRVTHTRKGTRPGSPLADAIFHALMLDITIELDAWIGEQEDFAQICLELDLPITSVVWSDDLAVCWATRDAHQLVPAICKLQQKVHSLFQHRGFSLNMSKGKTMAVPHFKGPGAPELRKRFILNDAPGVQVSLHDDTSSWLHFAAKYKHLGVIQSADGSFEAELRQRSGQAHSAFIALSKPMLCNKHLPIRVRLNLYRMMVLTKLFYGMGIWTTPTSRQMDRLFHLVGRHLRRILACGKDAKSFYVSDAFAFIQAGLPTPRVQLAVDRLLYVQKLFTEGPHFLRCLVQSEHSHLEDSWLRGVFADMTWLHSLVPEVVPVTWTHDLTDAFELWENDGPSWRNAVKRGLRKHLRQEEMMYQVHKLHTQIFHVFETNEGEFLPRPTLLETRECAEHNCFCGRSFSTPQGLSLHRRKAHGLHAPEHELVSGATCPCCLKYFWTSQRLSQHLSYISRRTLRNPCFQQLVKSGYYAPFDARTMPSHVVGLGRVDALQTFGPAPLLRTQDSILRANSEDELRQCLETLKSIHQNIDCPIDVAKHCTDQTSIWFQQFVQNGSSEDGIDCLFDLWFGELSLLPDESQDCAAYHFIKWGQNDLPDIIAAFVDGEAEYIVENHFAEAVNDLPVFHLQQRISHLRATLRRLDRTEDDDIPHRPVRIGTSNTRERNDTRHLVPSAFHAQEDWQRQLLEVKWYTLPPDRAVPFYKQLNNKPVFLIAHLFSGRRRHDDFHASMRVWADRNGIEVVILSLDTAVSIHYGNLCQRSVSWASLLKLYKEGRVAATLAGPPCETWTAARNIPLDPDDPTKGPRPLRDALRPWGLLGLSNAELKQCRQGSEFALQTMLIVACHLTHGGFFLGEHPDEPSNEQYASIWRTAIVKLLRLHPDCKLFRVAQWRWGCEAPKPTGLLGVRVPRLMAAMLRYQDDSATKPQNTAVGKDEHGNFHTSKFKEYPPLFGKALAAGIGEHLLASLRAGATRASLVEDSDLVDWISEAASASEAIREASSFLPDYQGL